MMRAMHDRQVLHLSSRAILQLLISLKPATQCASARRRHLLNMSTHYSALTKRAKLLVATLEGTIRQKLGSF